MRGWPLLPVLGGRLVRVGSAVVEEGSWSAGVSAALAKLSCRVLDTSVITLDVAKVIAAGSHGTAGLALHMTSGRPGPGHSESCAHVHLELPSIVFSNRGPLSRLACVTERSCEALCTRPMAWEC